MSLTDARRLSVVGLALCVAWVCSCATGPGVMQEALAISFVSDGWEIGHRGGDQVQRVAEFVRSGQTVENWTELVTAHTLNKSADLGSVEDQLASHQEDLAARCPGSTVTVTRENPDGVLYESHITNCAQGSDEEVLGRVLEGNSNRFVVEYAVRGAVTMTAERRTEWIERLMAVRVMRVP